MCLRLQLLLAFCIILQYMLFWGFFQAESDLNELKALMHSPSAIVVSGKCQTALFFRLCCFSQCEHKAQAIRRN